MAHEIRVPRLGWSMETGTFLGWRKQDGDYVAQGDVLFELESEKATQEVESIDVGILRISPSAPSVGSEVPVGTLLGYVMTADELVPGGAMAEGSATGTGDAQTLPAVSPSVRHRARVLGVEINSIAGTGRGGRVTREDVERHAPRATGTPQALSSPLSTDRPTAGKRYIASPRARRVARELGIDWSNLIGSGRGGRIRERDIRQFAVNRSTQDDAPRSANASQVSVSKIRRIIAERMRSSLQTTAPVTLTMQVDARNLVNLREQFKSADDATVPAYNDIIIKLVGDILAHSGQLAARWEDDQVVVPGADEIHVGLAVDTAKGLVVPVIRRVAQSSLLEISQTSADLVNRARAGTLTNDEMQGAVFTITNLGAYGVDAFTPIINLPESAILGLGVIRREAVVQADDQIVAGLRMTLSLTFDHRVNDGATAARFLAAIRDAIENPVPRLLS